MSELAQMLQIKTSEGKVIYETSNRSQWFAIPQEGDLIEIIDNESKRIYRVDNVAWSIHVLSPSPDVTIYVS